MIRHPLQMTASTLLAGVLLAGCNNTPAAPDSAAFAADAALHSRSAAACQNVRGALQAISIPFFDADGLAGFSVTVTDATGPLAGGSISATLVVETITADGTIHFAGEHIFEDTPMGDFTTSDRGITTGEGRVHDTLTLVSGATGMLQTHGNVDLETGALALRYQGRLCEAQPGG